MKLIVVDPTRKRNESRKKKKRKKKQTKKKRNKREIVKGNRETLIKVSLSHLTSSKQYNILLLV